MLQPACPQPPARLDDMASIRVLSLNISGHNVSSMAAASFSLMQKYQKIAELAARKAPQLLALQELHPFDCQEEMEALEAALQRAEYRRLSAARSHCGVSAIYVHASLGYELVEAWATGPCALASLRLAARPQRPLFFCGCHLEPFKEGATQRLRQVQAALESVGDPAAPLVLAGDCNMRVAEDKSVEQLGLTDAWAAAGGSKAAKFTWDSRENLYHGRPESEGYTARYDRIYVRSVARVTEFKLVAGEVTPGRRDFLSDHYGVEASFEL